MDGQADSYFGSHMTFYCCLCMALCGLVKTEELWFM